jgi:predicted CoA-binding protein
MFTNPEPERILQMLREVKSIAVVGLSPKEGRPSYRVARGMQQRGYRIVPVRPALDEVLGEKAYPNLAAVPGAVDIVDVFRAPEYVDEIVDECIRLGVKRLWLQEGVVNEAAARRAVAAGIEVVMDRCIWRDCLALCV